MANTRFRIESESPLVGELMFWSIVGHEGFSRASAYELTVLSTNPRLDPQQILGVAFDVVIEFEDADGGTHQRHCQGHAVRMVRCGQLGRYSEYRIVLRSWFWLLKKRSNSRIHQRKKLMDILNLTLDDSAISRFKKLGPNGVIGTHKERGYCVQYQESDYTFLSRLFEDEGIYYWFDAHDAPGTLMLADTSSVAHQRLPAVGELRRAPEGASADRFNEIIRWNHSQRLDTGRYAATDSNFKTIRKKLRVAVDASESHELGDLEEFEYTGGFFSDEQAQVKSEIRLDELPSRRDRHWALTQWPDVAVGRTFRYSGDPSGVADGDYLIGGCSFVATHSGYEGLQLAPRIDAARNFLREELQDDSINHGTEDHVVRMLGEHPALSSALPGQSQFLLTLLPADLAYKPPRLTPWVRMPGPQSAIVVGEHGEEQPKDGQDLYVDETGRVKVYFHWNRYEEGKKPHDGQKWSCWLRVSEPWAGKGYGGYFTPRIGQEVIVDFLDGNPDRPLIVGRVYNDDQEIPYSSPTQSGFRTRSTPKGGANHYNEIMFEDKKGAENINIHAERNMTRTTELDDFTTVGQHQTNTIKKNRSTTIQEGNDTLIIAKGNRNTEIQTGTETVTIKGLRTVKIEGGEDSKISPSRKTVVQSDDSTFSTTMKHYATGAYSLRGGTMTLDCVGAFSHKTGGSYVATAGSFKFGSMGDMDFVCSKFNRTVMENNDVVTGANTETYIGASSSTVIGSAMNIFQGAQQSMTTGPDNSVYAGIQIGTALGMSISNTLGVDLSNAGLSLGINGIDLGMAGIALENNALKLYNAGGPGSAAGATVHGNVALAAMMGAAAGLGAGLGSAAAVYMNLTEQRDKDLADLKDKVSEDTWNRMQRLRDRTDWLFSDAARVPELGPMAARDAPSTTAKNMPPPEAVPSVGGPSAADAAFLNPPAPGP